MNRRTRHALGFRVWGWTYPVIWWARRKPRSRFRQWLWNRRDALDWRATRRRLQQRKEQ